MNEFEGVCVNCRHPCPLRVERASDLQSHPPFLDEDSVSSEISAMSSNFAEMIHEALGVTRDAIRMAESHELNIETRAKLWNCFHYFLYGFLIIRCKKPY